MKSEGRATEVEKVFEMINELILSGEYPAGHRLVEAQLARTLGVSRTPVRIAIERLVSAGLARHVPNCGAVVRQMTFEEIRDLFFIRVVNEGLVARLASQRVREEDSATLLGILDDMGVAVGAGDTSAYYSLSHRIHEHIMDMAQSPLLTEFVNRIYMMTHRYHIGVMRLPGRTGQSLEEHRAIAEAVLSGDPDESERRMIEHIQNINLRFVNERGRVLSNL